MKNCHTLKMRAHDGKQRATVVATTEQLLRLIQSIPSPKAEPFRMWLAEVGRDRIDETISYDMATGARHGRTPAKDRTKSGFSP